MPPFQPIRFGKYLLLEKLATGGMAQLYRAKIVGVQGFEKFVALKQILPHLAEEKEFLGSFIDEAKLAALLQHQNIVQIYDFGNVEGTYFITMEYLFGKDLRMIAEKARERNLSFSLEHSLHIISRVCSGLDYAHKLKDFHGSPMSIIHRDISPQNIIITYEGDVKIVDFGIAKARSQSTITQVGLIKGKVAYMSPEQAAGINIDHRSDIFPCGILLYELLSGKRVFTGETLHILEKVRRAEFSPPEEVVKGLPSKVYQILHRALAKEPGDRYQSCGEMLADLEECLFELSMRPTARGLAQYMKDLFKEEISSEEEVRRLGAAVSTIDEGKPEKEEKPVEKSREVPSGRAGEGAPGSKKNAFARYLLLGAAVGLAVVLALVFWPRGAPVPAPLKEAKTSPAEPAVSQPAKEEAKTPSAEDQAKSLENEAVQLIESNPEKAQALLLEALKLNPASVYGHFQLGLARLKMKEYPKASESFSKASELDPLFPDALFNLGYLFARDRNYARAEEMYARVVKLSPSYLDEALFNLAVVQGKLGKKAESLANLEKSLAVNPNNEPAKKLFEKMQKK
ncbi:MAG: serine/threonine protein kinase with domain [Deltaproteobacteria bacterium]|nr:serine/threonine protein kinase with domain [Deltaproteobacteria bacterium]